VFVTGNVAALAKAAVNKQRITNRYREYARMRSQEWSVQFLIGDTG
jgi:hypothetical protein